MDFLQELFGDKALTWEQFSNSVKEKGYNLANLSTGEYVSKAKYDNELSTRDSQITKLNETLTTRDTDLKNLEKQLKNAGADKEALDKAVNELTVLQGKYKTDTENYQKQLSAQAYEFAAKEYAGKQKFTSEAAKRDFIRELTGAQLKMDKNGIIGADDFRKSYAENNADAFVVEQPITKPADPIPAPQFVGTTNTEGASKKLTLSELMSAKNENPNLSINF